MILSSAPAAYDRADQARMRESLQRADAENLKRGRDVALGRGRLIVTDEVTGLRYALTMNGGVVTWTAL
jgi:hypothetical protein